jgi:hypothetical protein
LEVEPDTPALRLVVPLILTLDIPMILKSGMAATWYNARALVWPTIRTSTAVVEDSTIQIFAGAALLLYTSRATVLGLTAMRIMMERALSLVKTQITI